MKLVLFVAAVVAALVVALWRLAPAVPFSVSTSTDAASHGTGGPVRLATQVCSTSWLWGQATRGHVVWEVVDDAGRPVADNTHEIRTADIRSEWWRPRECRTFTAEWDLRFWNHGETDGDDDGDDVVGTPVKGSPVPAGRYRVRITWHTGPSGEPPTPHERAVSETFTVRSD